MNSEEFILYLKKYIRDASIEDTISYISKPPGRKPHQRIKEISNWYNSQSNETRNMVTEIIKESIDSALFGILCALDGVRALDQENNNGKLILKYRNEEQEILLSNCEEDFLHDKYNQLIQEELF